MTSFKDARNLLLDSFDDGTIGEDELFVLYEEHFSKNPEFSYEQYEQFDMDAMDDTELNAKQNFALGKLKFHYLQKHWIFPKRLFAIKARQPLELKVSLCS